MSKKPISERKRLSAIFVSFTILAIGTISLAGNMSIDYYSVLGTLQKLIPASIAMGCLGWVMGMILDKPRSNTAQALQKYNNLYLKALANKAIKDKGTELEATETEQEKGDKPEAKEKLSEAPKINVEPKIEPEMGTK